MLLVSEKDLVSEILLNKNYDRSTGSSPLDLLVDSILGTHCIIQLGVSLRCYPPISIGGEFLPADIGFDSISVAASC